MRYLLLLTMIFLMVAPGCKKNDRNPFPNVQVDQYVYLNNPENQVLTSPGGWIFTNGGYRGIIVVRRFINGSQDDFAAFDRACPEHYNEDCSTLEVTDDNIFAECKCHGEKYLLFDGSPSDDATQGLIQYGSRYNAGVLYIYN